MPNYPSPIGPQRWAVAYELQYVAPMGAVVGFLAALAVLGTDPLVWLVGGLCWVFVATASYWWTRKASVHWRTRFRDHADYNQACQTVEQLKAAGLGSLASDVWTALSEASIVDEIDGREPNHGYFRVLVEDVEETIRVANRGAHSTETLDRTVELLREIRLELEDRDSS